MSTDYDFTPDIALEAIAARINGVFDHPALLAFGPLSTSRDADILAMCERGRFDAEVANCERAENHEAHAEARERDAYETGREDGFAEGCRHAQDRL